MAAPSPSSSPPHARPALRRAGAVVGYVTLGGLCLGGGIALRGVVDAGADQPRPPAAAAAVTTTTTETTIPMPTIVTTTTMPPPPPAVPTTVPAPAAPPVAAAVRAPAPAPTPSVPADRRAVWFELADCESGRWGAGKVPIPGTATWDVVDPIHQGGLQIRAGQWDQHRVRFPGFPDDAHVATPEQQIAVAEVILAGQGVKAWPTCGPRIGLDRLLTS